MSQVPASAQIEQLRSQLTAAFVRKEEAQATIIEADKQIVAIRNVLAGVGLGQQLIIEQQAAAAQAKAPSPEAPHEGCQH